jgi:hypothetical protein
MVLVMKTQKNCVAGKSGIAHNHKYTKVLNEKTIVNSLGSFVEWLCVAGFIFDGSL